MDAARGDLCGTVASPLKVVTLIAGRRDSMNQRLPRLLVILALCAPAAPAAAQLVRGTVTERASSLALSGVLVSLERPPIAGSQAPPVVLASVLTNERGEYSVKAPGPGQYVVTAKRIGVRRFVSPVLALSSGETQRIDVELDAVLYTLPEVVVSAASSLCLTRSNQAEQVASLWDEAHTALTATQISLRDRLFNGRISRYVRELDPRNLRVLSESRSDMKGILDKGFSGLSGDSLSKVGYWREMPDGSTIFNAPDADVLRSDAFLRDHCYTSVNGGRDRRGMVGIAFEPVKTRQLPDVRGTIWLDAKTFELRLVEFHYTRLQTSGDTSHVGGEVHFARLKSGAWIVRRWFIRMPQFAHYSDAPVGVDPRMPTVLIRPGIYRLIEEGGDVYAEGIRIFEKPATIAGVVVDSTGAPLAGATVRLAGTPFTTAVDSAGRFRLDSLPAGSHTIIAEHAAYSALGMPAADETVSLDEGETQRITLRAATTSEIAARLCDGKTPARGHGTLHLTMIDADRNAPLDTMGVWVHWTAPDVAESEPASVRFPGQQSRTDARGIVVFCNVPTRIPIEVETVRANDRTVHITQITLGQGEISARTLRTRRPK